MIHFHIVCNYGCQRKSVIYILHSTGSFIFVQAATCDGAKHGKQGYLIGATAMSTYTENLDLQHSSSYLQ